LPVEEDEGEMDAVGKMVRKTLLARMREEKS
jgi:hypothetical protein